MFIHIPINDINYPKRLIPHKYFYSEYKHDRPFFFHKSIINDSKCEALVPNISNFKDKLSFITKEYILDSILFEYCDYFIHYIEGEEINSTMLPLNPYAPTGIGGLGLLKKWGPNLISYSIIVCYDINNSCYQVLTYKKNNEYIFLSGEIEYDDIINLDILNTFNKMINLKNAKFVYSGYCNDSKNTDHAWIENSVYLFNLNNSERINLLKFIKDNNDKNYKLININMNDPDYKLINKNHLNFLNFAYKNLF
tara:strand:+ start:153 stop:908 length:756 start_codon:yes stop_codon:yes gene_type:complete